MSKKSEAKYQGKSEHFPFHLQNSVQATSCWVMNSALCTPLCNHNVPSRNWGEAVAACWAQCNHQPLSNEIQEGQSQIDCLEHSWPS